VSCGNESDAALHGEQRTERGDVERATVERLGSETNGRRP